MDVKVQIQKATDTEPVYLRKETVMALRRDLGWENKEVFSVLVSSVGGEVIATGEENAVTIKVFRSQDPIWEMLRALGCTDVVKYAAIPMLTARSSPDKTAPDKQVIATHDESTLEKVIEGKIVQCQVNYYLLSR